LGLLLVAVSVVVGARVLSGADETTPVWQVTTDLRAGQQIMPSDVAVVDLRLTEAAVEPYVVADGPFPTGRWLSRPLSSGELVPASALSTGGGAASRELPLGVAAAGVPTGLAVGDVVDVWAVPPTDSHAEPAAVLMGVTVVGLSGDDPGGLSSERQVLVSIPDSVDLSMVLDAVNGASVVLVRKAS
jgi:hypothetical protein